MKQVAVGDANKIWAVDASQNVFRWSGSNWAQIGAGQSYLKQISVGCDGTVWGISDYQGGSIWEWAGGSGTGNSWTRINGTLNQVSVGNANNIWGVRYYDSGPYAGQWLIYQYLGQGQWYQQPTSNHLKYISVANDGTVIGVNTLNQVWKRVSGDTWTNMHFSLTQISAGSAENMWGVNEYDTVYRRP